MNVTEILGFVTGALCVWLVARQHIWNWPIGICNNLLYLVVFLRVPGERGAPRVVICSETFSE